MANFKLLSKFIDEIESIDEFSRKSFFKEEKLIFAVESGLNYKGINVGRSWVQICTKIHDGLFFDDKLLKSTNKFNYEKLKDDIKSMYDIELIMIYGRELLDDNLIQRTNEYYGLNFTLEDYLESKSEGN